jgi:hypothetical protein
MLSGEVFYLTTDKNAIACSMYMGPVPSEPSMNDTSSTRSPPVPCLLQISNYRLTFAPQLQSSLSSSSRSKPRDVTHTSSATKQDSIGELKKTKLSRSNEQLRGQKEIGHSSKGKDKAHAVVRFVQRLIHLICLFFLSCSLFG